MTKDKNIHMVTMIEGIYGMKFIMELNHDNLEL